MVMQTGLTLAVSIEAVIVGLIIVFSIGQWVYQQMKEAQARAKRREEAGRQPQHTMDTAQSPMEASTRDALRQTPLTSNPSASQMSTQSTPTINPGNMTATELAERERARQQYAERAERLRAMREGRLTQPPGQPKSNPAPQQTRMPEPRPLPESRPLPEAPPRPTASAPPPRPSAPPPPPPRPQPVPQPQQSAPRPAPTPAPAMGIPPAATPQVGFAASPTMAQQSQARQQQQRAGQQRQQAQQQAQGRQPQQAEQTPVLGKLGTLADLRRAVILKEILDPPVSLRE
jgi:hypothetical protein